MDKSDYIKIKDFCSWKDTIKRAQCHELGEALCNAYPNEEFLQVCVRRAHAERKKQAKHLIRYFLKALSNVKKMNKKKHMFNLI